MNVRWILETPDPKWEELRRQHPDHSQLRTALVEYYLKTHPQASWGHIAGECLYRGKDSALQAAKEWIKHDKGMLAVSMVIYIIVIVSTLVQNESAHFHHKYCFYPQTPLQPSPPSLRC